jgi:hypothetical protein
LNRPVKTMVQPAARAPRATAIREGSAEKQELLDLFEINKDAWAKCLPLNDSVLLAMMNQNNWNRKQVATRYRVWRSFGKEESNVATLSYKAVLNSLEHRCQGVIVLVQQTERAHGIQKLLEFFKERYDEDDMKRIRMPASWTGLRESILKSIAEDRAEKLTKMSGQVTKFYYSRKELIDITIAAFHVKDVTRAFLYAFIHEFILQMKRSLIEADIDAVEDDAIALILIEHVAFPVRYGEAIGYIVGFLLCVTEKEGKNRKDKGRTFLWFARFHSLTKPSDIELARLGSVPIRKIDCLTNGGLKYPTSYFYETMVHVERICLAMLTEENLVAFTQDTSRRIHTKLKENKVVRARLCRGIQDKDDKDKVVNFVLQTFMRLRSKDFVAKLMGRSRKGQSVSTRTEQSVKSNSSTYSKNKKSHAKSKQIPEMAKSAKAKLPDVVDVVDLHEGEQEALEWEELEQEALEHKELEQWMASDQTAEDSKLDDEESDASEDSNLVTCIISRHSSHRQTRF